jgi:hypothetical protein
MAQTRTYHTTAEGVLVRTGARPSYQAYRILQVASTVAPILAGLDKFFNLWTEWDHYLAPWMVKLSPSWRPRSDDVDGVYS